MEYDAYYGRQLIVVLLLAPDAIPSALWAGTQESFWYPVEKLLARLTTAEEVSYNCFDQPWSFAIDSQLRELETSGPSNAQRKYIFCIFANQWEGGNRDSYAYGIYLANGLVDIMASSLSGSIHLDFFGGPEDKIMEGTTPCFLSQAGFVTSSVARRHLLSIGEFGTGTIADLFAPGIQIGSTSSVQGRFKVFRHGVLVGFCDVSDDAKNITYVGTMAAERHVIV